MPFIFTLQSPFFSLYNKPDWFTPPQGICAIDKRHEANGRNPVFCLSLCFQNKMGTPLLLTQPWNYITVTPCCLEPPQPQRMIC